MAGERAGDILGLALLQHTPPGLHALAGAELMRAVLNSAPEWRLEQLAPGAGFPTGSPAVVAAIHAASPQELRGAVENFLGSRRIPCAAYLDDAPVGKKRCLHKWLLLKFLLKFSFADLVRQVKSTTAREQGPREGGSPEMTREITDSSAWSQSKIRR